MKQGIWRDHRASTTTPTCERRHNVSSDSIARMIAQVRAAEFARAEQLERCDHSSTDLQVRLADDQTGYDEDTAERRCVHDGTLVAFGEGAL